MKKHLANMYARARVLNDECVLAAIKRAAPLHSLLDIGCWDGGLTLQYAKVAGASKIYGIELVREKSILAKKGGVDCYTLYADRDVWPFSNESMDCIVSNQVVEHLDNLDHYFSEAARVLKKGGILVTSTNNLASWHNVLALSLGWAPFDLTNSSRKCAGIGNPLAIHKFEKVTEATWTHRCVYTARWLFDWQAVYGLKKFQDQGAGLYPFPAIFGSVFKRHAAFMILTTKKI